MTVTVFSKPNCVQCNGTYHALKTREIDYVGLDISEDEDAFKFVKELGHLQVPVVLVHDGHWSEFQLTEETKDDHWSGHRPDRIAQLTDRLARVV